MSLICSLVVGVSAVGSEVLDLMEVSEMDLVADLVRIRICINAFTTN